MRYDDTKIPETYNKGRKFPDKTLDLWLTSIGQRIPQNHIKLILDVGSGTGRFSKALSSFYNCKLIGIDPSNKMLEGAKKEITDSKIRFISGSASNIPIEEKADMVFLSMVYHHIPDIQLAINEFSRVLNPKGYICIRNSTQDLVDKIPYLRYFPTAMKINVQRLPQRNTLIREFEANEYSLISHDIIEQEFASSFEEYLQKIRQRALSDLAMISDDEFNTGLGAMECLIKDDTIQGEIYELIDLFVFQKMIKE